MTPCGRGSRVGRESGSARATEIQAQDFWGAGRGAGSVPGPSSIASLETGFTWQGSTVPLTLPTHPPSLALPSLRPRAPACIPSIFWHFFLMSFYFVFNNSSAFSTLSRNHVFTLGIKFMARFAVGLIAFH